ncbi:hypothetical protein TNCV_1418741 [Trichonephila clavipes]|nr:hypothetical protein TNCV_1418741 [Trichonephila clavipes]
MKTTYGPKAKRSSSLIYEAVLDQLKPQKLLLVVDGVGFVTLSYPTCAGWKSRVITPAKLASRRTTEHVEQQQR